MHWLPLSWIWTDSVRAADEFYKFSLFVFVLLLAQIDYILFECYFDAKEQLCSKETQKYVSKIDLTGVK